MSTAGAPGQAAEAATNGVGGSSTSNGVMPIDQPSGPSGHQEAQPAANGRAAAAAAAAAAAVMDTTRAPESGLQHVPRDARLMALILQSMGVHDVQPPALMMLLEFAHRYLYEVLQDAIVYADHAGTGRTAVGGVSTLSLDDIQLSIQGRVNHSFTGPPSKDMLLALASSLNSVPLPPITDRYGMKLPPTQHCLTNVNFSIVPNPPPSGDTYSDDDEDEAAAAEGSTYDAQRTAKDEEDDDYDEDDEDAEIAGAGAADGDATSGLAADTSMADDGNVGTVSGSGVAAADETGAAQRGTKRALDEDDDYD